jgi:hypothetical protein
MCPYVSASPSLQRSPLAEPFLSLPWAGQGVRCPSLMCVSIFKEVRLQSPFLSPSLGSPAIRCVSLSASLAFSFFFPPSNAAGAAFFGSLPVEPEHDRGDAARVGGAEPVDVGEVEAALSNRQDGRPRLGMRKSWK